MVETPPYWYDLPSNLKPPILLMYWHLSNYLMKELQLLTMKNTIYLVESRKNHILGNEDHNSCYIFECTICQIIPSSFERDTKLDNMSEQLNYNFNYLINLAHTIW